MPSTKPNPSGPDVALGLLGIYRNGQPKLKSPSDSMGGMNAHAAVTSDGLLIGPNMDIADICLNAICNRLLHTDILRDLFDLLDLEFPQEEEELSQSPPPESPHHGPLPLHLSLFIDLLCCFGGGLYCHDGELHEGEGGEFQDFVVLG